MERTTLVVFNPRLSRGREARLNKVAAAFKDLATLFEDGKEDQAIRKLQENWSRVDDVLLAFLLERGMIPVPTGLEPRSPREHKEDFCVALLMMRSYFKNKGDFRAMLRQIECELTSGQLGV